MSDAWAPGRQSAVTRPHATAVQLTIVLPQRSPVLSYRGRPENKVEVRNPRRQGQMARSAAIGVARPYRIPQGAAEGDATAA
jgi:hypothetical protein